MVSHHKNVHSPPDLDAMAAHHDWFFLTVIFYPSYNREAQAMGPIGSYSDTVTVSDMGNMRASSILALS